MGKSVVIGGAFDLLHKGHKALISKAFELGDEVYIGLTSDEMARQKNPGARDYEDRKRDLERFLKTLPEKPYSIFEIQDPFSGAVRPGLHAIVVSPESRPNAERINELRKEAGFPLLEIVEIPFTLAQDGEPISDARIKRGEIDREGNTLNKSIQP